MYNEDEFETVSVDFTYVDEMGMPTHMCKTVESDYLGGSQLEVVDDLFKDFLLACGFSYLSSKRIEWVDDKR
jgi:hypothetical protein